MKTSTLFNLPSYTPAGAGAGTLNFATAVANNGFAFGRLLAVLNLTQNAIIYAAGGAGLGGTWNSGTSVLTLVTSTTGHNSADVLEVIWDDPRASVSLDAPLSTAPAQGWPSTFKLVSAATTNATVVKATQGTLGGVTAEPSSGTVSNCFLKIYDKATAPVAGDTPKLCFFIYGSNGAAKLMLAPASGIKFVNGISVAIVATSSDATFTAVAADSVILNLLFS